MHSIVFLFCAKSFLGLQNGCGPRCLSLLPGERSVPAQPMWLHAALHHLVGMFMSPCYSGAWAACEAQRASRGQFPLMRSFVTLWTDLDNSCKPTCSRRSQGSPLFVFFPWHGSSELKDSN